MSTSDSGDSSVDGGARWRTVLFDAVMVAGWVAAVSFAWRWTPWPQWAYYAVVFGGILGYSLVLSPRIETVVARR